MKFLEIYTHTHSIRQTHFYTIHMPNVLNASISYETPPGATCLATDEQRRKMSVKTRCIISLINIHTDVNTEMYEYAGFTLLESAGLSLRCTMGPGCVGLVLKQQRNKRGID